MLLGVLLGRGVIHVQRRPILRHIVQIHAAVRIHHSISERACRRLGRRLGRRHQRPPPLRIECWCRPFTFLFRMSTHISSMPATCEREGLDGRGIRRS